MPPNRQPKLLAAEALFEHAVRLLSRRAHTVAELRRKLLRRAAREADVDDILARLTGIGYLDDSRVAESHSFFRREYEKLGPQRVLTELRRRGVAPRVASRAVREAYAEADENELIRQHLRRKLGRAFGQPIEDPRKLARLHGALVRAGFSSDKIVEELRKMTSASEWLEALADASPDPSEEIEDFA